MFSSQANEVSATSASLQDTFVDGDDRAQVPVDERLALSSEQVRAVVRLFQCPRCSRPLSDPVTLPCAKTLCRRCLPEPHVRTNISYPATASRLQAFQCPFSNCGKEHAVGDCTPDVILNKVLAAWKAKYEEGRNAALGTDLVTHVTVKVQWEAADDLATQEKDPREKEPHDAELQPQPFPGGRLMATYLLADKGELEYGAEVVYSSPDSAGHAKLDAKVLANVKEVTRAEVDCQVCYALFYDAVTTPCGHTFCRTCLQRVLDHTSHCPICRRELTIQPINNRAASPPNELLKDITSAFWADLLDVRRQTIVREGLSNDDQEFDIAIFVLTLAFPLMPTFLHIFEPRYRLMIRRALEGDRTFGMVGYEGHGFLELGTVLRIVNVEFFADGRSLVESVGVSRFRILRHGVIDGYVAAKTERINDISLAEEEELEAQETAADIDPGGLGGTTSPSSLTPISSRGTNTTESSSSGSASSTNRFPRTRREIEMLPTQILMNFATDFVRRMREQSVGWLTARILAIYGECPSDPALFPWWFANILPVREMEKYRLLGTTSVRERLKICCGWILEWESSRWSFLDCTVS